MADDPRLKALLNQIENILLVLERPVVQRQLIVFAAVVLLAWLLPILLRRALEYIAGGRAVLIGQVWQRRLKRWLLAVEYTFFPILGIVLGQLAINVFKSRSWHAGLLEQWLPLFLLLLAYRLVVALLYAVIAQETASLYHRRILTPLFVVLVVLALNNSLIGTVSLGEIEFMTLLDTPISFGSLFGAAVVLYLFLTLAWVAQDLLRKFVLPRAQTDPGVINTILTINRYVIISIGLLTAISTLGFNLSALAIIGGGLSVGIGFGMQDLVANFVSGILLMFEQSLRPGDIIEVSGQRGTVEKLSIRSTLVRTADNVEIFVPNKNLLTSAVATYTHTNRVVRRALRIGVSYNSDPREIRQILLDVARKHGQVLKDPEPIVFFEQFGDSSLEFELAFWVADPAHGRSVLSDLHFMVWYEFQKHGIEIPFPQRDIHVRSGVPWDLLGGQRTTDGAEPFTEEHEVAKLPGRRLP